MAWRWKFWRHTQQPVVTDLAEVFDTDMLQGPPVPLTEIDGHFTVGRAAEKARKRARQGKPPHRIRTVPLEELRANPRATYRGLPTHELPPWAQEHWPSQASH